MTSRIEALHYPEDAWEETIRNTFLNAALYPFSLKDKRVVYDGYFGNLLETRGWDYLVVLQDLRSHSGTSAGFEEKDIVVLDQKTGIPYKVCSKKYLLIGRNDVEIPTSQIISTLTL